MNHQLPFERLTVQEKPQSYRQKQIALRKERVANKERLKRIPYTEAEESVRRRR